MSNQLYPAAPRFTSGMPTDDDTFSADLSKWMALGDSITGTPTVTVARADGGTVDLTVSGVLLTGEVLYWKATGGTVGVDYTFLITITTANRGPVTVAAKYFIRSPTS